MAAAVKNVISTEKHLVTDMLCRRANCSHMDARITCFAVRMAAVQK